MITQGANRDTWLAQLWLHNDEGAYNGLRYIIEMNRPTREIDLQLLVKNLIDDGVITDEIDLDLVDWKEIISVNQEA